MAPLKSLEEEYPIIDANFRHFCATHGGILSVEDFLFHDVYVLVALAEQNPTSERLKQGITQVLSIIDAQHQPWLNGMEMLEDAQQNKHILSTGYEKVDMLLKGGLREGYLTELVGPSSSYKTQVCLRVASFVAKEYTGGVIYLDTGNSFSPERIIQCLVSNPADKEANHIIHEKVLKSILCYSVFDIFSFFSVLHELDFKMTSQTGNKIRLLIVDSVSSLITPVLGGSGSHGHALMISAGSLLKKIAYQHNLAALVTNHMVSGDGGVLKPALGESWKSIPHVRLQLSRERDSNICRMCILKHPSLASHKEVKFMIL